MGGPALAQSLRPLCANPRYYSGGLPDLLLLRVLSSDINTPAPVPATGKKEKKKGRRFSGAARGGGGGRGKRKRRRPGETVAPEQETEEFGDLEGDDPSVLDGVVGLSRLTGIPMDALLRIGRGERLLLGDPGPRKDKEGEGQGWPVVEWGLGRDGEWGPRVRARRLAAADLAGVRCELVLVRVSYMCVVCVHMFYPRLTTTRPSTPH